MQSITQYATFAMLGAMAMLVAASIAFLPDKMKAYKKLAFAINAALLFIIITAAIILLANNANTTVFGLLHFYAFSALLILLFASMLALVNVLAYDHAPNFATFSVLLAFCVIGFALVPLSTSVITLLLGLELGTICSIFMMLAPKANYAEAALKLFILSAVATSLLLFALSLIFPYDGGLLLIPLQTNQLITGSYLITLALLLFVIGLSTEAAIFPFNLWVPDVYQGSPGHVSAMLASVNKHAAFVALMLVSFMMFAGYAATLSPIFEALSIATMFFGNITALVQTNVKRMFAYSSISQAGYIMIGFAAASQAGIQASIFQIFAHAFAAIGAFAIIAWLESHNIKSITDYTGLSSSNGIAALSLAIIMLSLIGIPPLIGFYGKFLLFTSAISSKLLLLALFGVINSFISVYYYSRVIFAMYSEKRHRRMPMPAATTAVVLSIVVVIIALSIYPSLLIQITRAAALAFPLGLGS